ncbi:MAG: hypothetical protein HYY04_11145 [Chloroflexi bacterium]|nr:hypothetical protein [Chloroflexota bacterium]
MLPQVPHYYRHCPYDRHVGPHANQQRLPKEDVRRAIERRDPEQVPCWFNWFSREFWALHEPRLVELVQANPNDFIMVLPAHPTGWEPDEQGANEFGVWTHRAEGGVGGQRGGSYLDDWDKLDWYLKRYIPDPDSPGRFDHVPKIVAENPGVYVAGHWAYGPFEQLHAIRGMEQLFVDLYVNRKDVLMLGEHLVEYYLGLVRNFGRAGVDAIFFTDDWGWQGSLLIDPAMWRQFFKPWYRRIFDETHRLGMHTILHSCGNITSIVGDLIDAGLDVLNPIQPHAMDARVVVREFRDHLTFCGGIDVQHFLVSSSPEEVEHGIAGIIRLFDGPRGGFIASPANSVMPETPLANVETMFRALRQHGRRRARS